MLRLHKPRCAHRAQERLQGRRELLLTEGLNVADRFRLVRELGRGGMGSVWLAEHTRLDALCAIKFIDREARNSSDVRRRFHHEAKAAAQLRSPHVVQILDHGEWEDMPYIAMEYLEGEDLAHRLHRVGRLSWGETCRIASHVARALAKAHAAGIVHRDIKPENIFLVRDDDNEIAKVLDFGIAQRPANPGEAAGSSRAILGTPFYMSPEQATGTTKIDHRSDLFSLAVIVYQCLTGELPFYSQGVKDIFAQILHAPLPIPSVKAGDLPPSFDAWWARAASRDPSERFQTAKEFAESLNLSLRVSEMLEITSIMPKADLLATGRISFVGSGAPVTAGPTLAIRATLDESFTRTFEPEPTFRKRKHRSLALVCAAIALVGGIWIWRAGGSASPDRSVALTSVPIESASAPAASQLMPLAEPPSAPPALEKAELRLLNNGPPRRATKPAEGIRSGSSRPAKAPKPTAAGRAAQDFGI